MLPAMRRRASGPGLKIALLALFAAATPAQSPAMPRPPVAKAPPSVTTFRSPDGSRFLLIPNPAMALVQWAVATPAEAGDEPPGLEGIAAAAAQASLGGTWVTGSANAEKERLALDALDQAWHDMRSAPQDPDVLQRLGQSQAEVQALGDTHAFLRMLAGLPVHRPEVVTKDGTAVLQLTTVAGAIGAVAERLVERREEQALRDLGKVWMRELVARQNLYDADPTSTVRAELLALAMPNHPLSRAAERAGRAMPRRSQMLAVWQATQRPERSVHVLVGNFDPAEAQATLSAAFTATRLPPPPAARELPLRPLQSLRRSTVPGNRVPMVAVAWVMPEIPDPFQLEVAAQWFAGGADSWLGRALLKAGRKTASTSCRAPWPMTIGGQSLLLVEVQDPAGIDGLADLVLQQSRTCTEKDPTKAELQPKIQNLQVQWTIVTNEPRWYAMEIARHALLWPQQPPRLEIPTAVEARPLRQLLARIFAGQPVIVEGRK